MSKMKTEVMEQLLKDLAAYIGYELIPNPFDTPFEEDSIKNLPDANRFFWTIPASFLNDKVHETFRKLCVKADIIDTVCTTSLSWPANEEDHLAILLMDVTRRRRGSIKFVDASAWNIANETDMAAVCNLLMHDLFPGEDFLACQMNEDVMDEGLDDCWDEQVCIHAACDVISLHPNDHIHKLGYGKAGMCILAEPFDIHYPLTVEDITTLQKPSILVSTIGKLCPQIVEPEMDKRNLSLDDKMLLVPNDGYKVDIDVALQLFTKEEVLRQLPITRRISVSDMWRVQIENAGLYTKEPVDIKCLSNLKRTSNK